MSVIVSNLNQDIILKENTKQKIYQNLNTSFNELNIKLEKHSDLELLVYNVNGTINANLDEDSVLKIYNISLCEKNADFLVNVNLNGKYGNVHLINVILGVNDSKVSCDFQIKHFAGHTTSLLETYAISKNQSKLILDNNAYIYQGNKQCDARQMTKGLNLSEVSSIKAQPNLFIDEYDVIASHNAAIGSIDKDELFYLMSRGLPLEKAQEMVVLGFIQPLLEKIEDEQTQEVLYNSFTNLLK